VTPTGQVNQPSNLLDRIKRLELQYQQLWKAIGLTSATIERGGLTLLNDAFLRMVDDHDNEIVYIGPDDQGKQIIRIRRESAATVLYTYTAVGGRQFWALTDNDGRIIVSDDAESGTGLARPWLQVPLYPKFVSASTPLYQYATIDAANLATEQQIWEGRVTVSHPKITINGVWGQATGSNTTTYRLKVAGGQIGQWTVTGLDVSRRGPFDLTRLVGTDDTVIELTADSNGTGLVAAQVLACHLRQS
jgi:hypothetical protein